ncbi:MAG: CHRD domain-containing protein [Verrucomicrobiota bacterium]|jgi:CHRD domain
MKMPLLISYEQATDLKRGLLYVSFLTAPHPKGEIRGQIQRVPGIGR